MLRVLLPLIILVLMVAALISCLRTDQQRIAAFPRQVWLLIIALVPIGGPIAWWVAGRVTAGPAGTPTSQPKLAPDDDPAFMRRVEEQLRWERQKKARDERRSQQENDLKNVAGETKDHPTVAKQRPSTHDPSATTKAPGTPGNGASESPSGDDPHDSNEDDEDSGQPTDGGSTSPSVDSSPSQPSALDDGGPKSKDTHRAHPTSGSEDDVKNLDEDIDDEKQSSDEHPGS